MTLSYSSRARVKRTIQARRGLYTLVIALATLAFLLSPLDQAWGAPASDINHQEFSSRQDFSARQGVGATITTPMMWTPQRITNERLFVNMGDHSLRLDSTGKAHIAFGGDHLYYASYDGANWTVETVDVSDNVGQYTSLFIDSNNHPHISYYDAYNGTLKYARNLGGGWESYTIAKWWTEQEGFIEEASLSSDQVPLDGYASPRDWQSVPADLDKYVNAEASTKVISDTHGVGLYTSIALDVNGNPYISYYDGIHGDLKCARVTLGQWYVDTVDSDGVTGMFTSIAVDNSNPVKIYISYYDYTQSSLRYAVWNGSSWSRITADDNGDVGQYTSLALDHDNRVRISYYDATNKDLKYAYWTGSTFVVSKVDGTAIDVGMYTSIALKEGATPHISYYDATDGRLRYAVYSVDGWSIYTISSDELSGWYPSIALDPNDNWYPSISYYSSVTGQLKYVEKTGATTWSYSMIDYAHDQGAFASMDLDSTEKPHVAFFDDVADVLNYAYWDGAAWQVEVVDSNAPVGLYCSLVLSAANVPHISYWDVRGRLKYATKTSGTWQIEYADPASGVGEYTSIALGTAGLPYISYYDQTNKHLRLTHKLTNGQWEVFVVDDIDGVGKYSSLAVDNAGLPHISYYDEINQQLKYATLVSGQWSKEVIYQDGKVGMYSSLALDSFGNSHIAYFRDDWDSLMYAYHNGLSWSVQKVDRGGMVGFNPSITVDSSNNPHISYYSYSDTSLKYARWTGSQWMVQTVDGAGDVGLYSSIEVLSSGYPVIAYYDATNGDLKYATSKFAYQTFLPYLNR